MGKKGRKAIYFTLDALFGIVLIGIALTVASKYYISEIRQPQISFYSHDIVSSFSNIRISELNNSYVQSLISRGEIINPNNTIIEQIGEFYILNKSDLARNLSVTASRNMIPRKYGFEVLINDESVYKNGTNSSTELISSRRLISGIEKFKPIKGATSKVYLESIQKKLYSKYLYFGGFVGQGNITGVIELDYGVNISGAYIETDAGKNYSLYINDNLCNSNLGTSQGSMSSEGHDLSVCKDYFDAGKNNITIMFDGELETSYIGGGYLRVDYYTDELARESENRVKEYLPGIEGIINLYSSFYVPGTADNISVYLHYYVSTFNVTNNTFYLTIGNETVFQDNNLTGEKTKIITVQNITKFLSLASMDLNTIPIRAGFENVTFGYIYEGNGDVVLITDISGSMDYQMGSGSTGTARNCDHSSFNLSSTARLSVAKCLDSEFVSDILEINGNRLGLVSFSTSTDTSDTVYPITDEAALNNTIGIAVPESGYNANGYTCICCGINSATSVLTENMSVVTLIASGASWLYNNFSFTEVPIQDSSGNNWYDLNYANESGWFTGSTILGSTNSYSYTPGVDTEIGNAITNGATFVNLSEVAGDQSTPQVEFSSGLSYTANTWGTAGNSDGWDSDYGIFGRGSGDIRINLDPNEDTNQADNTVASDDGIRIYAGTGWEDSNNDCTMAAAAGIEITITSEMYEILNSANGKADLTFDWYLDRYGTIDDQEAAWVKVQFGTDASMTYLGGNKDNSNTPYDSSNEVYYCENDAGSYACPGLVSNTSKYSVKSLITAPGSYYMIFGGAVDEYNDNDCDESFEFRFDNILLSIANETDKYYFRKHFNIADIDTVQRGILNVLSDDSAKIYLNGNQIYEDSDIQVAEYWNARGKKVSGENFRQGDNVIAVELSNANDAAKFDLELLGVDNERDLAMMVMTDGQANVECAEQSTGDASQDAIQAACEAREDYGIIVYAVGYSDEAEETTLMEIAQCGDGVYVKSSNVTELKDFYQDVASTIVSAARHSQTIEVSGNITSSILYPDSYIMVDYTPITEPPAFGEISIIREEKNFDNCTFNVNFPTDIRISDAKLTSYSSEHWTDLLTVNGDVVFNLSEFSDYYGPLGDPFLINIPPNLIGENNTFYVRTGDSPDNFTGCSLNNSLIYTAELTASVSYKDILEKAVGCTWDIEFDDGTNTTINVPPSYSGAKQCYYTSSQIYYDANDTYDDAMFSLLDNLDFDDDGRLYLNLEDHNFVVGAISVGKVPYPWGPAIAEVRIWR